MTINYFWHGCLDIFNKRCAKDIHWKLQNIEEALINDDKYIHGLEDSVLLRFQKFPPNWTIYSMQSQLRSLQNFCRNGQACSKIYLEMQRTLNSWTVLKKGQIWKPHTVWLQDLL